MQQEPLYLHIVLRSANTVLKYMLLMTTGLKSLATWLELKCGGRVCPMITSPEAQV
jgi:hypothetical protein